MFNWTMKQCHKGHQELNLEATTRITLTIMYQCWLECGWMLSLTICCLTAKWSSNMFFTLEIYSIPSFVPNSHNWLSEHVTIYFLTFFQLKWNILVDPETSVIIFTSLNGIITWQYDCSVVATSNLIKSNSCNLSE